MFQKFYPSEYYTSTYVIDFAEYYKKGYRGILFDIDNTLVPHNAPATEEAIRLIHRLKEIGYLSGIQQQRAKSCGIQQAFGCKVHL